VLKRTDVADAFDLESGVLHDFLAANRTVLIDRCRNMVATRSAPKRPSSEIAHGIPIFLDQIIETLTIGQSARLPGHAAVSQLDLGSGPDVGAVAMLHGRDLLDEGFSLEQVIRDYGDVCQAVTSLASETGAPISADEFHTFNRCLDDAIAAAVTEYSQEKAVLQMKAGVPARSTSARVTEDLDHLETALTQTQLALADTEAALTAAQQDAHEALVRSLHDSLTGLPNRELFDDRLTKAISLADRHNWTLAVMFLDLDRFKRINDAHGHATGDIVLQKIAERLLQYVRDEDTVCRNGGDEFLYLLMNPRGQENVRRIANSVLWGVAEPVVVDDREFVVKPSIGIAIYPDDGHTGDDLIVNADAAMYRAKKALHGVAFFDRRETPSIVV
jgi:diguanylate cyclase (GGDEF)-like protein